MPPESDLAAVAAQVEQSQPETPSADSNSTAPSAQEDNVPSDAQQVVSQPKPQGKQPKTPPSAMKKAVVKKSIESVAKGFRDDPSDADYTPSECLLSVNISCFVSKETVIMTFYVFSESSYKSSGSSSYMSSRGRRIRKPPRRNFPPGEPLSTCSVYTMIKQSQGP